MARAFLPGGRKPPELWGEVCLGFRLSFDSSLEPGPSGTGLMVLVAIILHRRDKNPDG